MYYCTHSDKNYLAKGIALCKSIIEKHPTAAIYYLCLDETTYDAILNLSKKAEGFNVVPVHIDRLLEDKQLKALKESGHTSNYGDAHAQFCWSLTPYFTWWLLTTKAYITELLYCDADLFFYKSPETIFEACKHKSIGIHTHRFGSYDPDTNDVGEFNVGCVYFKNDNMGRKVATQWCQWLLNPQNEYAQKYGTCGDQKYLDLFIPLFGAENIAVFDRDTNPKIDHGAPWNFSMYNFSQTSLTFNHFSHFKTDFNGNWSSSNHGEWKPEVDMVVMSFYIDYNKKVTEANQLIGI